MIIVLLLTNQNRQGFPSFWIQKIRMKTNQTWQFFTISELYQNLRQGQKMVADIYIYNIYIYRFLQNVRFWRVRQAQVPWGKGGIGKLFVASEIFFLDQRWYGMDCEKRCFCADARWWRARWPCALRLESCWSWWNMKIKQFTTQEGIMEIKHLVFAWTSFSSNSNKGGSPYTNISYANICNKNPPNTWNTHKYTFFFGVHRCIVCCLCCPSEWLVVVIASMVSPPPGQDQDCLWRRTPGRWPQLVGWFGCIDVFFLPPQKWEQRYHVT